MPRSYPDALSPECRLVFRLAGPDEGLEECVRALVPRVRDWDRVLGLARHEFAEVALWRALQRVGLADVPPAVVAVLRPRTAVVEFRMRYLASRLGETVAACVAAEVPVIMLKGAALADMTDGRVDLRPMVDVDLLVPPEFIERAKGILLNVRWTDTSGPVTDALYDTHHHLAPYADAKVPDLHLELHRSATYEGEGFHAANERLWEESRPARSSAYEGARVPSDEWLLWHACVHFAWSHGAAKGAWRTFRAVTLILERGNVNWSQFTALAISSRGATYCYWTLRLAGTLSDVRVPPDVLERLALSTHRWLATPMERHLVNSAVLGEMPPMPSRLVGEAVWNIAMRAGRLRGDSARRGQRAEAWNRIWGREPAPSGMSRLIRNLREWREWQRYLRATFFG